ncbi:unnamed protein product [Caenorhabditis sp. 36 PRJEB53466]|nr:unnamed protein product [Caenorhabditis sp. 36 PRJEB53466]
MSANKIERISKDVAERLTTAQVVVSLSSALRQLIDNSIDAGSTIIDIRVKNNGFDSIEVQDNGCGIETLNFDALCKPHSTSKLTQLSDFDKLATLGFRGEALNALCTVSNVIIFTRAADSEIGHRLVFDHHGSITQRTIAAREFGTTIIVEKLFETLPVRRKELERSSKREFVKLLTAVQSFALLCPHIKMLCTNTVAGKKINVICTPGGTSSIGDVVRNLFGASKNTDSDSLVEIKKDQPNEEIMTLYSIPSEESDIFDLFNLRGFVSSCEHGSGRGTSDRQFVYINNRPVDYTRVTSTINEVYKQFNKSQYPVIVLFIDVPPGKIDVNVTPDKKTVMLEKERHFLAILRASMLRTYLNVVGSHSTMKSSVEDRRKLHVQVQLSDSPLSEPPSPTMSCDDSALNSTIDSTDADDTDRLMNMEDLLKQKSPPAKRMCSMFRRPTTNSNKLEKYSFTMEPKVFISKPKEPQKDCPTSEKAPKTWGFPKENVSSYLEEEQKKEEEVEEGENTIDDIETIDDSQEDLISEDSQNLLRPQQKIMFSMKTLRDVYRKRNNQKVEHEESGLQNDALNELTTEIRKEEDAEAERQLSRSLQKNDFLDMKIVGQFNKGFIICSLRFHLFIVDQHASDEKYNFEKLQKSAKLTKQPLFTPTPLSFGSVQEMIIRENLNIFQSNGFDFDFRENDGCLKTFLTARPEILSQHLTNNDLEEIVAVVSEYPYQMYRPARVRSIFASRACRKSVMIGKSLDQREMIRIIRHLAKLEQPWNCPHGRPTIRHLVSLRNILDE